MARSGSAFVPWDSQPVEEWAAKHAPGRFVDLDGRRTHYVTKGEGPPVILVHGFNMDLTMWYANIDALARRFTVYALDLWGSGYSTREPMDYGYNLFAGQVRSFMEHLEIARAHLVGHSMGGGTLIVLALKHRQMVDRLVLEDAAGVPHRLALRGRLFQLPFLPELLLGLRTDVIRRRNLADYWLHDSKVLTDEVFELLTRYQKIRGTTRASLQILRRNFFDTLDEELYALAELRVPTLIVWGRQDRPEPVEFGQKMHEILAGSRLEVLDGAGHLPNIDRAERFNDLVLNFLAE